jgi:Na+-exporting ATPase
VWACPGLCITFLTLHSNSIQVTVSQKVINMGKANNQQEVEHVSGQSNKPISKPAHALSYEQVANELGANTSGGLTSQEAEARLNEHGNNELDEGEGVQPAKILLRQIANAMILVKRTI